jgi:hypothetical protein
VRNAIRLSIIASSDLWGGEEKRTMKEFIERNGLFELKIPLSWKYRLIEEKVHTFEDDDNSKAETFQVSLIEANKQKIKSRFSQMVYGVPLKRFGENDFYCLPDNISDKFVTKIWIGIISGYIVNFTLTYSITKANDITTSERLNDVYSVIESLKIIEPEKRRDKLKSHMFFMFIKGVAATTAILNNAVENKAFIEATCILANQIDALLRTGIVLKNQLLNKNNDIDEQWVYQGPHDKKKSEKDIYQKAKSLGIIDEVIYNKLFILYEDRNRVVHRFIISEITLAEVEYIAFRYYQISNEINRIIYEIEQEQIKMGIGITTVDKGGEINELLEKWIDEKLGRLSYFENKAQKN